VRSQRRGAWRERRRWEGGERQAWQVLRCCGDDGKRESERASRAVRRRLRQEDVRPSSGTRRVPARAPTARGTPPAPAAEERPSARFRLTGARPLPACAARCPTPGTAAVPLLVRRRTWPDADGLRAVLSLRCAAAAAAAAPYPLLSQQPARRPCAAAWGGRAPCRSAANIAAARARAAERGASWLLSGRICLWGTAASPRLRLYHCCSTRTWACSSSSSATVQRCERYLCLSRRPCLGFAPLPHSLNLRCTRLCWGCSAGACALCRAVHAGRPCVQRRA
jgi:hypothetical protein